MAGVHRSPYHGFSIEFAEHREYVPGDDLRYVDWKVFGKTDKIYLKQYEEETNLVSYLLLDTSESMRYRSERGAAVEAGIRPVRRRGAGLSDSAAAGQRRPGHLRQRNPGPGPGQQQSVALEATAARHGKQRARAQDEHRPDLSRSGRAAQETGRGGDPQRPVRRRDLDAGRPEAFPPPPARGDPVPRARSGRARFSVPANDAVQGARAIARRAGRPASAAAGLSARSSARSCRPSAKAAVRSRSTMCRCAPISRWRLRCRATWPRG